MSSLRIGLPQPLEFDGVVRSHNQTAARYKLSRWAGTGLWPEVTQRWFEAQGGEPLTLRG